MTRKHFNALAQMVRALHNDVCVENDGVPPMGWDVSLRRFVGSLMNFCAQQNDRFDREKFFEAAWPENYWRPEK
jgi:hypothetical protein